MSSTKSSLVAISRGSAFCCLEITNEMLQWQSGEPKRTKPKTKSQRNDGEAERIETLANKMMKPAIGCDFPQCCVPLLACWMTSVSSQTKCSKPRMTNFK